MDETTTQRPVFVLSDETKKAISMLSTLEIGQVITWQELQAISTKKERCMSAVTSARKHLLNEQQRIFGAVRGIGYKRLDDAEIVKHEHMHTGRIRRSVKRSMKRLATVKPDNLAPLDATAYRTTTATLGALHLCSSDSFVKQTTQRAISGSMPDPKEMMRLFAK